MNNYDPIQDVRNVGELNSLLENERVDALKQMAIHGSIYARTLLFNNYGLGELNIGQDQFVERGQIDY